MSDLRIEHAHHGDEALLRDWRHVHNAVIPAHHLTLDAVRDRAARNHLEVAYLGDVLVGCSTVRPEGCAEADPLPPGVSAATVIARVLPEHRRQGFGEALYESGVAHARMEFGATVIETVVLESNEPGLRFALQHGFTELERYELPGDGGRWVDLRLG
ncbi:GNAT family N-acetyltransferase [Streptomyces coeruleoprunus]|uniref:GNAT family N-acetyltransferase n=1 Tax=Streptomyces coeruleoprunus TaxID=285563 RepID=A0ABV9XJU5_9ACTN